MAQVQLMLAQIKSMSQSLHIMIYYWANLIIPQNNLFFMISKSNIFESKILINIIIRIRI